MTATEKVHPSKRLAKLRRFVKSVEIKHGAGVIKFAPKVLPMPRLTTGSLLMDVTLGGGVPVGRITLVWGKKSAGKSYLAYRVAAENQNRCANCLRHVEIEDVVELFDEESGEVFYEARAQCDCYNVGLFKPKPFPEERESKAKDGLKREERQIDGKKTKVVLFHERLERYKKNSYEEFRVVLIDVENTFDPMWCAKLGCDVRRLIVEHPARAEETIDIYDAMLRTGAVDLIILDSLAQMTPTDEIDASTEDWQQGLQARLLNKMCRKAGSAMVQVARDYGRPTTQIWINQTRLKIGGTSFGPSEVRPGGMGQEFAPSVELRMWACKWESEEVDEGLNKDDKREVGVRVRLCGKTEKNKTAPPRSIGSMVLNFKTGQVEEIDQVVSLCERYGILKKTPKNKWLYGGEEFKTKTAAVEKMADKIVGLKKDLMGRMLDVA